MFTNLYQNLRYWTINMSFTFNMCNYLKRGFVCAVCAAVYQNPKAPSMQFRYAIAAPVFNSKLKARRDQRIKYRFSLFITPNVRDVLFAIHVHVCMCFNSYIHLRLILEKLREPSDALHLGVIYHKAWNIIFCYNPSAAMKYHVHWSIVCLRQANQQFYSILD